MKYDPESPAMTDSCVEKQQTAARCFLFPGLRLRLWYRWWRESIHRSFRILGNKCTHVYLSMQRFQHSSLHFSQCWSVSLFRIPPPLQLHSVTPLTLAHLAIFISEEDASQNASSWFPECADSVTLSFTCILSSSSFRYWNAVTETHTYCNIKLRFDSDLPSFCLVRKVYEVDECLHICSPS